MICIGTSKKTLFPSTIVIAVRDSEVLLAVRHRHAEFGLSAHDMSGTTTNSIENQYYGICPLTRGTAGKENGVSRGRFEPPEKQHRVAVPKGLLSRGAPTDTKANLGAFSVYV